MTAEEKDRLKVMYKEYRKMLLIQAEAYETEMEQETKNTHDIWEMNDISPWEL